MLPDMTLANRIAAAMKARGLNQNQLAGKTGLTAGYLGKVQERNARKMNVENATLIANALGVPMLWLLTGEGEGPDVPVASPAPPPISDVRITDDATDDIINAAFDPTRHKPSDLDSVTKALHITAMLLKDNVDPVDYVRRLLDAQAEARAKGRKIPPEQLPFAALGMTERLLRISQEKNAADTAEARAFIEREQLPALAPGEVHPEIKRAQERERKRREGR